MSPQEADSCNGAAPLGQILGDLLSPFHRRVNSGNFGGSTGIGAAFALSFLIGDVRGAVGAVLVERHDTGEVELQRCGVIQHDRAFTAPVVTSFLLLVI